MTTFDPQDPQQAAAVLLYLRYDPVGVVDTLVTSFKLDRGPAIDLVARMVNACTDVVDDMPADEQHRLAAIAAEWLTHGWRPTWMTRS